ncbi:MAG: thioredoxin-disulfide reductase [Cytophagales bacterium]|nr:MAG: thioredoxin-disulfide reductase [Cytophagales bacterium]
MEAEKTHCLIIGAGPAGYTAAIYASRAGLQPILYQGLEPGGQLMLTGEVENFPGYPNGVMGQQMMAELQEQAARFGTDIRLGMVTKVDFSNPNDLKVWVDDEKEIHADSIIISTGASAKWLGLPSEKKLQAKGVSSCAVCDGFFYRGQDVVVVGGGDSAAEEASYLSKICNKVYLLVRKNEMRASKIMQARVKNASNIEILWNTVVEEVLGEEEVIGVRIKNTETNATQDINANGFFVAIGHQPNTNIFTPYIATDEQGYIITEKGTTRTNIEGVFACGDVQDHTYRQAVTAAASGCMAALDAERYLAAKEVMEQA